MNKNYKATFLKGVAFALVALFGCLSFNVTAQEASSGSRTLKRSINVVTDDYFVYTYNINNYHVTINDFDENDEIKTWISVKYDFDSGSITEMLFHTSIWSADQEDGINFTDDILNYFKEDCKITYYLTSIDGTIDFSSDDNGLLIENYNNEEVFSHWYSYSDYSYSIISLSDAQIVRFGSIISYNDFITSFNRNLMLYQYALTPLGLFEDARIKYGLLSVDTDAFVNGYSNSYKRQNGGFLIDESSWDVYYDYYNEQENPSSLQYAISVDFPGSGVSVTPYKRLITLGSSGSNFFGFGQGLKLVFNDGYVYNVYGAEVPYNESTFDLIEISNQSTTRLLKQIVFTGANNDYIPFGLKTSTDFTSGYDSGYKIGFEDGKTDGIIIGENNANDSYYISGYKKGYDEGVKSAEHPITISQVLESVIKIPTTIISEGFDFDILGINVGELIKTLIVVALAIFAINIFRKG